MKKCPSCGREVSSEAAVCRCGNRIFPGKNDLLTFYMLSEEEIKVFERKPIPDAVEIKTDIPQYNTVSDLPPFEKSAFPEPEKDRINSLFKNDAANNGNLSMSELAAMVKAAKEEADKLSPEQNTSALQRAEEEKQYNKKVFRQCRLGVMIILFVQTVITFALFFLYDSFEGSGAAFKVFYIFMWVFYLISPAFYQVPVPDSLEKERADKIGKFNEICFFLGTAFGIGTWIVLSWNLVVNMPIRILLCGALIVLLCLGIIQAVIILKALSPRKQK